MRSRVSPSVTLLVVAACAVAMGCRFMGCGAPEDEEAGTGQSRAGSVVRAPTASRARVLHVPTAPAAVIVAEEDSDADPPGTQFTFDALAEPSSGGAPLDVEFSLALEDPPPNLTVSWDFGDGTPGSDLRNPSHRYRDAGEYTVVVRISAPGIDEDSREIGIEVTEEAFDVDIEADPDIGPAPLTTRFNAVVPEDLEPELTCSWDFGDGTSGSGRTTEHTYREPGTYSVKLAVTHSNQQRGTREIEVQVDPPDEDEEEAP